MTKECIKYICMAYHSGNNMINQAVLFEKSRLRGGMHIADFGCGSTGHIVFRASQLVGTFGIVYAVDILKDVLESIQKRAADDGMVNIHTVWADVERVGKTAIPERSLDAVFLVNILVHTKDREAVLEEAMRLLKEKARLVIVDWARPGLPFGPKEDQFIDFGKIKQWGKERGLAMQEEFDAGKYHKGMVLFKA